MRWLFLLILSVNLAYIAWQVNTPTSATYSDVRPLKGVTSVVLLSEVVQSDAPQLQNTVVQSVPDAQISTTETLTAPESSGKRSKIKPEADEETDTSASSETDLVEVAAVEVGVATSQVPDETIEQTPPAIVAEVEPVEKSSCFTLGPFRDSGRLNQISADFKDYTLAANIRESEESEQTLHWVNIKPAKNRKQANKTAKRLKNKKIKDFFVIREGENVNGISLGYYRNKESASNLTAKVKKLGFDVVLDPIFKTYAAFWLDYSTAAGTDVPASLFKKHIKEKERDKISNISRECD